MLKTRLFVLLFVVGLLGTVLLEAQRRFGASLSSLQKEDPTKEFAIVRWYSSGWQGDGWSHDYPTAEEHILQIMREVSVIDPDRLSYKIVDLASQEIFKYPFAYVSHPGEVFPSDEETEHLREYIERGGVVMPDDFGGRGRGPG